MTGTNNIIRIASYNIASTAYNPEHGIEIMNGILRENRIDLAGIQELDYCNERNNYDMLRSFTELGYFPHRYFQKSIDFRGGEYGIGILSRYQPLHISGGALPNSGEEGRSFARMLIEKGGRQIAFYNTHLSYESTELRRRQIDFMIDLLESDPCPLKILTGDFNVDQNRGELLPFTKKFSLSNGAGGVWYDTFNRQAEHMNILSIDNIIFSSGIRLVRTGMVENNVSDHNMFYAELELL